MITILSALSLGLALAACGDDGGASGAGDAGGGDGGDAATTGTLAVGLEELEGILIEGFELGLRVETAEGEVIDSILWSEFVESLGTDDVEAFYDSVYEVEVPSGEVVVLAELNVGIGPAPSVPDPDGDLPCRLPVEVGAGERVQVEVSFDGSADCLRLVEDVTSG